MGYISMTKLFKRFWANQDGNIGIMGAIGGSVVLAASALAIESNHMFGNSTDLQSALDAATLAAASGADQATQAAIAREVFDLALGDSNVNFAADGVQISRSGEFIVGTAEGTIDAIFGGVLMPSTVNVTARSVVGFNREQGGGAAGADSAEVLVEEAGVRACIISLASNNGLTLNSGARIEAPDCEVHVHATSTPAVSYTHLTLPTIYSV